MGVGGSESGRWRFGRVLFDEAVGKLTIDGQAVEIDRSCVALLAALLRRIDEPLGKDELLEIGWPDRIVHENSLAKAIGRLRQSLGEDGARIEAVYGSGYRLRGPVKRLGTKPSDKQTASGIAARLRARLFADRRRVLTTCSIAGSTVSLVLSGL